MSPWLQAFIFNRQWAGKRSAVPGWIPSPIINKKTDGHQDYIQVRSCESEHAFAEKNLFRQDNYDYLLIFAPDNGIIFLKEAHLIPEDTSRLLVEEILMGKRTPLLRFRKSKHLTATKLPVEPRFDPIISQTKIL